MLYAIVAVIALILDQAVKYWTSANIVLNTGKVGLIPGFIHLSNIHNYGAAFSFMEGARWFFVVLCILFAAVVIFVLAKNIISTPVARWMAIFVMAGAIGNCIDRIVCGYVVDMFEFEFFSFPVFNVADIFITCGAIAFCLCVLFEKEDKQPKKKAVKAAEVEAPVKAEKKAAKVKAEKAPKAERAPRTPRRKKTEIPTFPRRETVVMPAIDPNDPFAEWEARLNAQAEAEAEDTNAVVYTQPEASESTAVEEPTQVIPVVEEAPVVEEPTRVIPVVEEAPMVEEAPVTEDIPSFDAEAKMEFNLDDILAEFKDY